MKKEHFPGYQNIDFDTIQSLSELVPVTWTDESLEVLCRGMTPIQDFLPQRTQKFSNKLLSNTNVVWQKNACSRASVSSVISVVEILFCTTGNLASSSNRRPKGTGGARADRSDVVINGKLSGGFISSMPG